MRRPALNALIDKLALRSRLLRVSVFRSLRKRARAARISAFSRTQDLPRATNPLSDDVETHGAHTASIQEFFGQDSSLALIIRTHATGISELAADEIIESDEIWRRSPELYLLGLDRVFLDAAEQYLNEPCLYLGISIKRERANEATVGARQWHMDIEDDRMLRFLVYLCDVDETNGPFNYVPAGKSALAHERLRYRSGYMCDDAFGQAVSPAHQQAITGPFGTMIVFDGTRIFHRAHPPTNRDRLSLSCTN
jgi:hypothetical protein